MPVGAALAGAGIASAGISALGAKSAANTQVAAADRAAEMQLGMFNTIRDDLTPYRQVGSAALPGYMTLLGIGGTQGATGGVNAPSAAASQGPSGPDWDAYLQANPDVLAEYNEELPKGTMQMLGISSPQQFAQWHYGRYGQPEGRQLPTYAQQPQPQAPQPQGAVAGQPAVDPRQTFLENTPGYQFIRDQGMQAITNQMSARGLGGVSGAYGKGLARFVTGLADQTYQSTLGNYASAVGVGQNAANQTGTFGTNATTGAAGSLLGGANAAAAGTIGAANAGAGAINSGANAYLTSRLLGMYGG